MNWYIVWDRGKVTLVDAGVPRDWSLFEGALVAGGLSLNAIDSVLLTHAHSDHTGFAERARSEAGATVRIHAADEGVAKGGKAPKNEASATRYLLKRETYRTLLGLAAGGGLRIVPVAEVSTFSDGEVLDVPGRPRVVHVPGHTAGMSALWFEDVSTVCTSDALVTRNVMTGRLGPQVMPASLNVSSAQALESLGRLEETGAELVLPGHGELWRDGVARAVEEARRAGAS